MRKTTEELWQQALNEQSVDADVPETFRRLCIENERECAKAVAFVDGFRSAGLHFDSHGLPVGTHLFTFPPTVQVPEGWLRAVDEELVSAHLNVANVSDTYEEAKKKLSEMINWHIAVAIDPRVNGGYKLVPIEPTAEMFDTGSEVDATPDSLLKCIYKAMLAAAPEVK